MHAASYIEFDFMVIIYIVLFQCVSAGACALDPNMHFNVYTYMQQQQQSEHIATLLTIFCIKDVEVIESNTLVANTAVHYQSIFLICHHSRTSAR